MPVGLNRFEAGWLKLFERELPPPGTPYRPSGVAFDVPEGTKRIMISYEVPRVQFLGDHGQSIGHSVWFDPGKSQKMQNR